MKEIVINNNTLQFKEHLDQRVVTFKEIDTVHGRKDGTASRCFRNNRNRFIEGVDYFRRNSSEAKKEFGITAPNGLILMTESGYLMLAKSFTDDLAWTVQRELVNNYFRRAETLPKLEKNKAEVAPKIKVISKPRSVNVDDCIVALEVLREIKHHYIVCKQEYEEEDPTLGMVAYYEKSITAVDEAIQSVGMWLMACSSNKRLI